MGVGLVLVGLAILVGFGIVLKANKSVRDFKDDEYVSFTAQHISSIKK